MGVAPVMLHTHATAVVTRQLIYVLPLIAKDKAALTPMKEIYTVGHIDCSP